MFDISIDLRPKTTMVSIAHIERLGSVFKAAQNSSQESSSDAMGKGNGFGFGYCGKREYPLNQYHGSNGYAIGFQRFRMWGFPNKEMRDFDGDDGMFLFNNGLGLDI